MQLDTDDLVIFGNQIGCVYRSAEGRVFTDQVLVGYPQGGGSSPSNGDRYLVLYGEAHQFLQGWHTDGLDVLGDDVLHQ